MERRDFFSLMAVGGGMLGASGLGIPEARANWSMVAPGPVPGHDFDGRLLVNKPVPTKSWTAKGSTALTFVILAIISATNCRSCARSPRFAVMPRDEKQPTFLVAAGTDLMFLANGDREYPEIVPYSFPLNIENI